MLAIDSGVLNVRSTSCVAGEEVGEGSAGTPSKVMFDMDVANVAEENIGTPNLCDGPFDLGGVVSPGSLASEGSARTPSRAIFDGVDDGLDGIGEPLLAIPNRGRRMPAMGSATAGSFFTSTSRPLSATLDISSVPS